jgi:hypothetical protein
VIEAEVEGNEIISSPGYPKVPVHPFDSVRERTDFYLGWLTPMSVLIGLFAVFLIFTSSVQVGTLFSSGSSTI